MMMMIAMMIMMMMIAIANYITGFLDSTWKAGKDHPVAWGPAVAMHAISACALGTSVTNSVLCYSAITLPSSL